MCAACGSMRSVSAACAGAAGRTSWAHSNNVIYCIIWRVKFIIFVAFATFSRLVCLLGVSRQNSRPGGGFQIEPNSTLAKIFQNL